MTPSVAAALRAGLLGALGVFAMTCRGPTELAPPTIPPIDRKPTYLKFTAYPGDVLAPGPQTAPAIAGAPFTVEVSIMAQDSAVIAVGDTVNLVLSGGSLASGTTTLVSNSGIARFTDLVIDSASFTYQFTATTPGLASRLGTRFTVMPGSIGSIRFVGQPTEVWAGTTRYPDSLPEPPWWTVVAYDQFGNARIQGHDTVTLSITPGSGTPGAKLGGTYVAATPNAIPDPSLVFFHVTIDKVGSGYSLTAKSGSVVSAPSGPFKVDPVLAFLVQPGQATPGAVLSPAVQVGVVDGNDQPVPNIASTVRLTMSGSGGTLMGTLTQNASTGTATFSDLAVNKYLGVYQLRATATGTVAILDSVSQSFLVHGSALQVVSGDVPCAVADDNIGYCFVAQFQPRFDGVTPTRMVAGDGFECALTGTGQAWCRGDSMLGELGRGPGSIEVGDAWSVGGGLTFTQLSAGSRHVCGVASGGVAYCWGWDSHGQVGDSVAALQCYGTPCDTTPTRVAGGLQFSQLSAGQWHTCGLTTSGQAYCWGNSTYGQLGNFLLIDKPYPVPVYGGLTFASLGATRGNTPCALTTAGEAYCWGMNNFGQVGNGTIADSVIYPVPVQGGLTFTQIVGGLGHTCGLTTGGQAYCWGLNESGELGDGTYSDRKTPVAVIGGLTFVELATGWYSSCGRTAAGAVYCWGDNSASQLGDGTTLNRTSPRRVVIF